MRKISYRWLEIFWNKLWLRLKNLLLLRLIRKGKVTRNRSEKSWILLRNKLHSWREAVKLSSLKLNLNINQLNLDHLILDQKYHNHSLFNLEFNNVNLSPLNSSSSLNPSLYNSNHFNLSYLSLRHLNSNLNPSPHPSPNFKLSLNHLLHKFFKIWLKPHHLKWHRHAKPNNQHKMSTLTIKTRILAITIAICNYSQQYFNLQIKTK